jgi:hypothetical protein
VIQHHPASILAYWCRVEEWRVQTSEKLRVNTISQIRPSISMGFWLLHINTSSIARRTIYTTALGIKSLFTPIILEHPPGAISKQWHAMTMGLCHLSLFSHLYSNAYLFIWVRLVLLPIHPPQHTNRRSIREK